MKLTRVGAAFAMLSVFGAQIGLAMVAMVACGSSTRGPEDHDADAGPDVNADAPTCCCHFLDGPVEAAGPDPANNLYPCKAGTACTEDLLANHWTCEYPHM